MDRIIGTCSICGGPVTVPTSWLGVYPPVPTCRTCGAIKKESYGPVIDMDPPKSKRWESEDDHFFEKSIKRRHRIDEGRMRANHTGGILGRIT